MLAIYLISIILIAYTFVGYPIIVIIISFVAGEKNKKEEIYPYVSLVISAYNEEEVIQKKIENSLKLDYPSDRLQIVIASESVDNTNKIVKEYRKKGIILYEYKCREGKRATLFKTIPLCKGEIIIFSDANSFYNNDAIKKIVRNFADKRVGCVSGRLIYRNIKKGKISQGESAYWKFDIFLKKHLSRLFALGGGVNGSIFAIRKYLYDPIDKYRGDDFEISCRVELKGYASVFEDKAISYEEATERAKQEFRRKIRLASWNFKSTLILIKEAIRKRKLMTLYILVSHRLLRYTTPIWLLLLFLSNLNLQGLFYKISIFAQIIFYTFALMGFIYEKIENKETPIIFLYPFYFCLVNVAALIAIVNNLVSKDQMFWEKVR